MRIFTKGDKVIVALVLVIAAVTYIAFAAFIADGRADSVQIFVDGALYASYNLNEIKGEKTVEISSKYGTNTLLITSDGARMTESSCPDKTDVRCGEITKPGQVIICAPNRVLVRLSGDDNKIDKVTY